MFLTPPSLLHMQVASLLKAKADDTALAAAVVPMICSRLIASKEIPQAVIVSARSVVNGPADVLRYSAGEPPHSVQLHPRWFACRGSTCACVANAAVREAGKVCDFSAAADPIQPLLPIDVASNIGAAANSIPAALRAVYNNPGAGIANLFTTPENCPTQAVR